MHRYKHLTCAYTVIIQVCVGSAAPQDFVRITDEYLPVLSVPRDFVRITDEDLPVLSVERYNKYFSCLQEKYYFGLTISIRSVGSR